jgi:hypothetical protein
LVKKNFSKEMTKFLPQSTSGHVALLVVDYSAYDDGECVVADLWDQLDRWT